MRNRGHAWDLAEIEGWYTLRCLRCGASWLDRLKRWRRCPIQDSRKEGTPNAE